VRRAGGAIAFGPDGKSIAVGFTSDGFTGVWTIEPRGGDGPNR
jgi:hypothetical protein